MKKIASLNALIDQHRPEALVAKGVGRSGSIFAYPDLEVGHGLSGGVDQRFFKPDTDFFLTKMYEVITRHDPAELEKLGVHSLDAYIKKMRDPDYLRQRYPGEVLELKVDPADCYVGDMDDFSDVAEDIKNKPDQQRVQEDAEKYWAKLITLTDFKKWYRLAEWDDSLRIIDVDDYASPNVREGEYSLLKGAPDGLKLVFETPEILIPQSIPPEHLRILD